MAQQDLYPFTSASLAPSVAIGEYRLTVSGETLSLGQTNIRLVRTGEEGGFAIYDVVGDVTPAIGSVAYSVSTGVYATAGLDGVIVRGADGKQAKLGFLKPVIEATDDAHARDAAGRTTLAGLISASIQPNSILLNPSMLQVTAQPSGFNYDVKLVQADQDPEGTMTFLVVETRTGPGWPKNGGIGPVVLPVHLHKLISSSFSGTVVVIGKKNTIKLKA